jgi:methylated-DNA-[protein]-cysteine S-methyltransferase
MLELEAQLSDLGRERAPATLLARVRAAVRSDAERYFELSTEAGRVFVAYGDAGLTMVHRTDSAEEFERAAAAYLGRPVRPGPIPGRLRARIERALAGRPADLDYDLRRLTEFERAVLRKALEIPRGEFRTYGWIAREIGRPKAVRAVGSALARNPIPLFIPCHRVVRSDGTIGEYGMGGPEVKRRLLLWEGVPADRLGPIRQAS